MKSLKEVGFKKAFRFVLYSLFQVLYHNLIDHLFYFPQSRKLLLILLGAKIGKDSMIMDVAFFNWHHKGPGGLSIGESCFLGDKTLIDLYDQVILEDQVTIAQRVTILTHLNVGYSNHPLQKYFPKVSKRVVIENGSVVGTGSIILPGVVVGSESFVAAGSVVTKDVLPKTLVGGVPAALIRKLK